ncbi:MAG TPA: AbiV family abortive infection protein [Dermatophilaceae bacterium]
MPIRKLPDLSPEQVVKLQDALLSNADALLVSALSLLDQGRASLARSLAILGLEESGKAIAVHERRVQVVREPEGTLFRCEWLDALWASHEQKLNKVYDFLLSEPYWFAEGPPNPDENAAMLGTIKRWAGRHDNLKKRGFYVELDRNGKALSPADLADEDSLRAVLSYVHQIGWQLRLGEHIEGKQQDQQEAGSPPCDPEFWGFVEDPEIRAALLTEVPGQLLNNAPYRFNPPGADRSPFRNLGKPGYEADTRQLVWLHDELERDAAENRKADSQ